MLHGPALRNELWRPRSPRTRELDLLNLRCVCDDSVGADRIKERLASGKDFSEATVAVRDLLKTGMDPWPSAIIIDTSHAPPSASLESALSKLFPG